MKTNKILCLDIATETGWALFNIQGNKTSVKFGVFTLSKQDRILSAHQKFAKLINKHQPDIILIEDVYLRSVKSFKILCMLHAVTYLEAIKFNKNIRVLKAGANSIRKKLGIKNKTRKTVKIETLIWVGNFLKKSLKNDNEADALCVGIAYINYPYIFKDFYAK